MSILETLLVAIALGCDAFAVGLGVGTRFCSPRQVFRLSFHFGLFQFLMPLLGWFLGKNLSGIALQWGPWIAAGLLFFIGAKMAYESFQTKEPEACEIADPTRGLSLVVLSLATSVDALGVGISLGIMGHNLFLSALCIGLVACAMTWIAMKLGNRLTQKFGRRMEMAGAFILIAIALRLLLM